MELLPRIIHNLFTAPFRESFKQYSLGLNLNNQTEVFRAIDGMYYPNHCKSLEKEYTEAYIKSVHIMNTLNPILPSKTLYYLPPKLAKILDLDDDPFICLYDLNHPFWGLNKENQEIISKCIKEIEIQKNINELMGY